MLPVRSFALEILRSTKPETKLRTDGPDRPSKEVRMVCQRLFIAVFIILVNENASKGVSYDDMRDEMACAKSDTIPEICTEWMKLAGSVEVDCRFRLKVGLFLRGADSMKKGGPALVLQIAEREEVIVEPHDTRRNDFGPMICFNNERPGSVLLMVVSSIEYLWMLWPYFVHKVKWAESVSLRVALWIGELPLGIAQTVSKECEQSQVMQMNHHRVLYNYVPVPEQSLSYYLNRNDTNKEEVMNSNHYIKALAAYALLRMPSTHIHGVFYADMDSIAQDQSDFGNQTIMLGLTALSQQKNKDVFFSHEMPLRLFWQVKGHSFFVKNSIFGRRFLAAWLYYRCGFKDQYALWHSILKLAYEANCTTSEHKYDDDIFKLYYKQAKTRKRRDLPSNLILHSKSCNHRCTDFRFDCSSIENCRLAQALPLKHKAMDATEMNSRTRFQYYDQISCKVRYFWVQDIVYYHNNPDLSSHNSSSYWRYRQFVLLNRLNLL